MPYILEEERELCDSYELMPPETSAQLCYILCRLLTRYTEYQGMGYSTFGEIRNAVYGAMDEYKNVVIDPYERNKRHQNKPEIWGELPEQLSQMARSPLEEIEV